MDLAGRLPVTSRRVAGLGLSLSAPGAGIRVTSVFYLHLQVGSLPGREMSCMRGLCSLSGPLWAVQGEAEMYFILVQ